MKTKRSNAEAISVIDRVRRILIDKDFHCLSGGDFGLPSYTDVEAWSGGPCFLIYLLFDRNTGGWDILAPIDATNSTENTWASLDKLKNEILFKV